jgi:hypothetical protein
MLSQPQACCLAGSGCPHRAQVCEALFGNSSCACAGAQLLLNVPLAGGAGAGGGVVLRGGTIIQSRSKKHRCRQAPIACRNH